MQGGFGNQLTKRSVDQGLTTTLLLSVMLSFSQHPLGNLLSSFQTDGP